MAWGFSCCPHQATTAHETDGDACRTRAGEPRDSDPGGWGSGRCENLRRGAVPCRAVPCAAAGPRGDSQESMARGDGRWDQSSNATGGPPLWLGRAALIQFPYATPSMRYCNNDRALLLPLYLLRPPPKS